MSRIGISGGQYNPLSDNQVRKIHETALDILEHVGFTYESGLDDTLDLLESAGAVVSRGQSRVFFPPSLVMEQAHKAPDRIILYGREGQKELDLGEDRVHLGTGGAAIKILDINTGNPRSTVLMDLYLIGKLVDTLENIHFFLRPCIPHDIEHSLWDENIFHTCFRSTSRHIMGGVNDVTGLHKVADIAAIIAGGKQALERRPIVSVITSFAISPLKLCTRSTQIMQEACRLKIPVVLSSAPAAGSSSPLTMAGTLAQLHAEELAGITIGQLTNPGAPQIYGGIPGAVDLRTMGYRGGAVECGMMNAAIHQMARFIGVPNYNSSGLSDSKIPDAQAGWEKAMTTILAALGGSNFIHHAAGMLESMLTVAYEQYVIDDEIIGMSLKVLQGIAVDDEHLAVSAIKETGPGGSYMMAPNTLDHMGMEFFEGNGVTDRTSRNQWEMEGSLDARSRAGKIARQLISRNAADYISGEADQLIREKYNIVLPPTIIPEKALLELSGETI